MSPKKGDNLGSSSSSVSVSARSARESGSASSKLRTADFKASKAFRKATTSRRSSAASKCEEQVRTKCGEEDGRDNMHERL